MKATGRRGSSVDLYAGMETATVDSRRHILDCAARLFRNQGYAATSLRNIADAAGMKAASLYYHFPSKDQIVIEVLNLGVVSVFNEVQRTVEALPKTASCEEQFKAAVTAHLRSLLELQDYTSANTRIFAQTPSHVRAATLGLRSQYERYWTRLLKRCSQQNVLPPRVNLRLLRLFLFGAMNGTLEWYDPNRRFKVDEIALELSAIFLGRKASRRDK